MNETTLRFLMADGAISATFSPALTPAQYEELYTLVRLLSIKDDLRKLLESAAQRWGIKVAFDGKTL